jgi:hypothetical protein
VVRAFFSDFQQDVPIQRQIGHQALQPGVLVPELPELPDLEQPHVRVPLLPGVVGRLADPYLPTQIRDWLAGTALHQSKQDLLLSELGLLHCFLSLPCKDPGSTLLVF